MEVLNYPLFGEKLSAVWFKDCSDISSVYMQVVQLSIHSCCWSWLIWHVETFDDQMPSSLPTVRGEKPIQQPASQGWFSIGLGAGGAAYLSVWLKLSEFLRTQRPRQPSNSRGRHFWWAVKWATATSHQSFPSMLLCWCPTALGPLWH